MAIFTSSIPFPCVSPTSDSFALLSLSHLGLFHASRRQCAPDFACLSILLSLKSLQSVFVCHLYCMLYLQLATFLLAVISPFLLFALHTMPVSRQRFAFRIHADFFSRKIQISLRLASFRLRAMLANTIEVHMKIILIFSS